jgi:hypothetical protein
MRIKIEKFIPQEYSVTDFSSHAVTHRDAGQPRPPPSFATQPIYPPMPAKFALASLVLASLSSVVSAASSCIASDVQWNLLAFGFNGKDYNAGTQDSWAQGQLYVYSPLYLLFMHQPVLRDCDGYNNNSRPTVSRHLVNVCASNSR